jgi:hypothetical protein
MTVLQQARALSNTRIRVDFSGGNVDRNSGLSDIRNYVITGTGVVVPVIISVDVPGTSSAAFVELLVPDMQDGASYSLSINPDPLIARITSLGAVLASGAAAFTGSGKAPQLLLASAPDSTHVRVTFSEAVYGAGVEDVTKYTFDLGLTALSVEDAGADFVLLKTSAQTAGTVYTLTFNGVAKDSHNNVLSIPANTPMLGFVVGLAAAELPKLQMYTFIIEEIRKMDANKLLERLLNGPQEIWEATQESILNLKNLIGIETVPDYILKYHAKYQGWGRRHADIIDSLEPDQLRALLFNSPEFWRSRGPEDAMESLLRLVTGQRLKLVNWFDLRTITDEMMTGVEQDRRDLYMLSNPVDDTSDSYQSEIRIVDDGELDRESVRNLARVGRQINERVFIKYLGFLDTFDDDGDLEQWTTVSGSPVVENRALNLLGTGGIEEVFANPELSPDWAKYHVSWLVEGTGTVYLQFYRTGNNDYYAVKLVYSTQTLSLVRVVAGAETSLASVVLTTLGQVLLASEPYTFTIVVAPEGATNRIVLTWEGVELLTATDNNHAQGTIGVKHNAASSVKVHDLEMFFLPTEYDLILPNS